MQGEVLVEKIGRTESHVVREDELAAEAFHQLAFVDDLASNIVFVRRVLVSLDVKMGLHGAKSGSSAVFMDDRHEIHQLEAGEKFSAELGRECGSIGPLVDVFVSGDRNHQDVAELT